MQLEIVDRESLLEAAVLVLSYEEQGREHYVLTRRTEMVLHHKGQVCFPGGAKDPGDKTLWETALREAREEIGLEAKYVRFLKELPSHVTPTGFHVTPFLASLTAPVDWTPSPDEIAEIFSVPADHLRDPQNLKFVKQEWQGQEFINPIFTFREHQIWGMTGRILCDLLEIQPEIISAGKP